LFLGGYKLQYLKDWSRVSGGLAQGDWDSSGVVMTGRDSGEQEFLDDPEPYNHDTG
jgi:hypothetical protein